MMFDYGTRITAARQALREQGVDGLLLSVGSDLPYFTGYEAMPLERLTMLVFPADGPIELIVPELEAPRVDVHDGLFEIAPWAEGEDPVRLVANRARMWSTVLIGDQTWSTFLLGLQAELAEADIRLASDLTKELRMRKGEDEIAALRRAGYAADRVVERLRGSRFSGLREREVARMVADWTVEEGHQTASFSAIVGSGPNGASPHHESGGRVLEPGDAVVIDFGGKFDGYCSDTTRNFVIGQPPPGYEEAFSVLLAAQKTAVDAVRPGVPAQEIDRAARGVIEAAGFGDFFIHRTGHGIGLEVHEYPYIIEGNDLPLEPGMAFSIEPGIYIPGQFGMRIEDIVTVTGDGVERLNISDRAFAVVE